MDEAEASGHLWRHDVEHRGTAEQDREALSALVDYDADPFEVELLEQASDPQIRLIDQVQRSYEGQYRRRLRRLRDRKAHRDASP
ncbi:hypothetical protein ACIBG8_43070 [Nonomuraea sp. NPDC050556]|uniref:hypothetical protein n=1 Tax=Nonomuraea sp. NPDC050556 TaxID=3364369 RepID=UPI0037AAF45D